MSEYQRYEFMTVDRPLTRAQLDDVNSLSSHIEATSTSAFIEYNYGSFKHDPIGVLRDYFDGFLYWANWGSPQLAFRFPHGVLPGNLLDGYDLEDFATFIQHSDYDILNILFGEMEPPDLWTDYDLGSLIAIRDELMEGDLRSLYIVWLAAQGFIGSYEEEDYEVDTPPVPPALGTPTAAQQELAELLQVPEELLVAAGRHSTIVTPSKQDDFSVLVERLSQERRSDYLLRLAHNEPELSRQLVKELRELDKEKTKTTPSTGEHVTFATLHAESEDVKAQLEREKREQERQAHLRELQDLHDNQDQYWHEVNMFAVRGTGVAYDEVLKLLLRMRESADHFNERQEFDAHVQGWTQHHLRRPSLLKRLQENQFPVSPR